MKYCLFVLFLLSLPLTTLADVWVEGYYRSNGTYVKGHWRSSPNDTKSDNWSTRGNLNPHTGRLGTRSYDDYSNNGRSSSSTNHYHDLDSAGYELPGHYGENGDFYHDDGNIYNPYIASEENDSEWVGKWRTEATPKAMYSNNKASSSKSKDGQESTLGIIFLASVLILGTWGLLAQWLGRIQYFLLSDEEVEKADYYSKFSMTVATIVVGWVLYLIFLT